MTLGARLIIFILLAAVPVFVIQISTDYEIREGRKAAVLRSAETLAGLVAARQDRVVEGARLLLEAASHLQAIQEKNAELCNRRLRQIMKSKESQIHGWKKTETYIAPVRGCWVSQFIPVANK